jgi:hypothetical protein
MFLIKTLPTIPSEDDSEGWLPRKNLSLSLGSRNLFDNQHHEFGVGFRCNVEIPDEVRRAFYMQMNYRF